MFLGIDSGTFELKALLMDQEGRVVGQASSSLQIVRPQSRWSKQDSRTWWQATMKAIGDLRHPAELAAVRARELPGRCMVRRC